MAQIVISIGVHATEINAARSRNSKGQTYAEELKEKLEAAGHQVTIVKRSGLESSTSQVLDFNERKTILQVLWLWKRIQRGKRFPFHDEFSRSLSLREKNFLNAVLRRPEVKAIFDETDYVRFRQKIVWHGLRLAERLKPSFRKYGGLIKKAKKSEPSLGGNLEPQLAERFSAEYGDGRYRAQLSRRFPNAHIIDLHNSPPQSGSIFEWEWKVIGPIAVRRDNTKTDYGGGSHGQRGAARWITVELPADRKEIDLNPKHAYTKRFYWRSGLNSIENRLRAGVTDYEIVYGTHFFPANTPQKTTDAHLSKLVGWIHRQVTPRTRPSRRPH